MPVTTVRTIRTEEQLNRVLERARKGGWEHLAIVHAGYYDGYLRSIRRAEQAAGVARTVRIFRSERLCSGIGLKYQYELCDQRFTKYSQLKCQRNRNLCG